MQPDPYKSQSDKRPADIPILNKTDVPKKWSEFQQIKTAFFGLGWIIAAPVAAYALYKKGSHQAAILAGSLMVLFGLLLIIGSWISYRRLRRAEKNSASYSQFQTDTAANYSTPTGSATVGKDERIISWVGPVIRADKGAIGYTVLSQEQVKQAENTLLFTPTQIIAVMLTPDDAKGIQQGALGNVASAVINYSPDSAGNKDQDFRILFSNKWDQLMAGITAQPLQSVLQSHLNYSIPYSSISSVRLKNGLINPGFVFELSDGSKLRFGVYKKDQIKPATQFLSQYVKSS